MQQQNLNWRILLHTLLGQHNTDFEVETNKKEIIIKTNRQAAAIIQKNLQSVLQSPINFRERLPYTISTRYPIRIPRLSDFDFSSVQVPPPDETVEAGVAILYSLFGDSIDYVLNVKKVFGKDAKVINGVLYSAPITRKGIVEAWEKSIQHLISYFKGVDVAELRRIWQEQDTHLPEPPSDIELPDTDREEIANGLIQQCFAIVTHEEPVQCQLAINYRRIYELIFAPQIIEQPNETIDNNGFDVELHIARNHFMSYIQQLAQGGVLLRMFKSAAEAEEEEIYLQPIFFSSEPTAAKEREYTLLIDRSGSMDKYFGNLKGHIKDFVKKVNETDPDALLRLVFFATYTNQPAEFKVNEWAAIERFIDAIESYGQTRLFGTITDELKRILQAEAATKKNRTIVLFTDGYDNMATNQYEKIPLIQGRLDEFRNSNIELPKIFTLDFGDSDSNTMKLLSTAMGTPYIRLTHIDDFSQILQHIESMQTERKLIQFLCTLQEASKEFTIPIAQNNSPQVPGVIIPCTGNKQISVAIDNNQLVVTLKPITTIPTITIDDQLTGILREAENIRAAENIMIANKTLQMGQLLKRFEQLQPNSTSDATRVNEVKDQIEAYRRELDNARHDSHMQQSIASIAQARLGFLGNKYQHRTQDSTSTSLNTGERQPQQLRFQ